MAKTKSKLEIISKSLSEDSKVVVLPFVEDNADELREYFREGFGEEFDSNSSFVLSQPGNGHQVVMSVAPARGLYTGTELQKFMEGLVPELTTSEVNRFMQDVNHSDGNFLSIGSLNFREVYGREKITLKRVCKLADGVFANDFGFKDGKKEVDEQKTLVYRRLIHVRVFPNEEIGRNALQRYQDSLKAENKRTGRRDLAAIQYVSLAEIQKYAPNIVKTLKARRQTRFI